MSDWESPGRGPGEIFLGFCWSSIAAQLTAVEMPGVYWDPSEELVACADHVEALTDGPTLTLSNPTAFDAEVLILCETDRSRPLPETWWLNAPRVAVPAHTTARLSRREVSWSA